MKKAICLLLLLFVPIVTAMELTLWNEVNIGDPTIDSFHDRFLIGEGCSTIFQPPPPPSGGVVLFSIYNNMAMTRVCDDIGKKEEYELIVAISSSYVKGTNTISWDTTSIPKRYKVKMIDDNITINMNKQNSYTFDIEGIGILKKLTLKLSKKGKQI